ncbi:MAG: DUF4229 domain-containing protein [Streptomycetales bacterium]
MSRQHPALQYSGLRLALLLGVGFLLWLTGLRGLFLLAAALVISGLASYSLLSRQRDAMAAGLARRTGRWREGIESKAASEDTADDATRRRSTP